MNTAKYQIPELDRKGLRDFAFVTGAMIAGLFGLFLPWLFDLNFPTWPWVVAAILFAIGLIGPMALQPVYKVWMRFGLIMSKFTTPLIMGLVFFIVITPIGLIRKLTSADAMTRKFDSGKSYRLPSKKSPAKNMERPF